MANSPLRPDVALPKNIWLASGAFGLWNVDPLRNPPSRFSAPAMPAGWRVKLHSRGVRQKLALTTDSRLDQIAKERSKEADHHQPCPECQEGPAGYCPD